VSFVGATPRLNNLDFRQLRELRESLEAAVEDDGKEERHSVILWFAKCIIKLCKCAINPVINPKLVRKSRTPQNT
jgi:hypothetical protein